MRSTRIKFEADIEDEKRTSVGLSLGRFGIALVPNLVSTIINTHLNFQLFVKINVFEQYKVWSRILGRFGIDLGSQMEPKWDPKWSQSGTKHQSTQRFIF